MTFRAKRLHCIMAAVGIGALYLTYNAFDVTPPSYVIAMWAWPHKLYPGQSFIVTEVFVRNRRCVRLISHGFRQAGIGHQVIDSPPPLLFPRALGLMTQKFEAKAPITLATGPAEYRMSLTWLCPFQPRSWFGGINTLLSYPVEILKENTKDCLPGETTILIPGGEVEIKCTAREKTK